MKSLYAADIRDSQSVEVKMVDKKIAVITDFPEDLALRIKHMLVRHHGAHVFGAPKSSWTLAAVVLHPLDDLDGRIQAMQNLPEEEAGSKWTAFHRVYGRSSYRNHSGESE
jgi:3'-5' exoribonuclease